MQGIFLTSNSYAQSYQQEDSGNDIIERIDKDGDGKVSRDEFPGPSEHFTQFDKDEDGYLDESELPDGPPPENGGNNQMGNHFSNLDKDNDGKISQDEFPGPSEHFTEFDKDSDGYLVENEMPKGPPPRGNRRSN